MSTAYGNFHNFCRDTGSIHATLPVCNLFAGSPSRDGTGFGGCDLEGIPLSGGRNLANLGSILCAGLAVLVAVFLIMRSNMKRAAVGRREMQLFLIGYIIISICEIFTVGYQILDDGTIASIGLIFGSAAALFVGTGYIALDTGFAFTDYWQDTVTDPNNRAYALYTLYQLVPLIFLVAFFILEATLVLRILGEVRPMFYLGAAAILFAISQIFQYVISVHICNGSNGAINGGFFSTLFTLLSVIMIWVFWSSITEDDWPMPASTGSTYT